MTAPDEYTAQHLDEEAALEAEESLEGRPYEIAAAQSSVACSASSCATSSVSPPRSIS
jgi:hypothetical protein